MQVKLTDVTKGDNVGRTMPRADSAKRSTRKHNITSKFLRSGEANVVSACLIVITSSLSPTLVLMLLYEIKNKCTSLIE